MNKDILKKAVSHFNHNEMEELNNIWHDDLQVIRLMTNDVLVDGKAKLTEMNKPYMDEGKAKIKIINTIEFDNILIAFLELSGLDQDYERIAIYEIIDGKFKRTWISQFKKDEEQ